MLQSALWVFWKAGLRSWYPEELYFRPDGPIGLGKGVKGEGYTDDLMPEAALQGLPYIQDVWDLQAPWKHRKGLPLGCGDRLAIGSKLKRKKSLCAPPPPVIFTFFPRVLDASSRAGETLRSSFRYSSLLHASVTKGGRKGTFGMIKYLRLIVTLSDVILRLGHRDIYSHLLTVASRHISEAHLS